MHQLSELKLYPLLDPPAPSQGFHRKESFTHMQREMGTRLQRRRCSNGGSVKEGWDRLWFLLEVQPLLRKRWVCLCLGAWSRLPVVEGRVTVPCVLLGFIKIRAYKRTSEGVHICACLEE